MAATGGFRTVDWNCWRCWRQRDSGTARHGRSGEDAHRDSQPRGGPKRTESGLAKNCSLL